MFMKEATNEEGVNIVVSSSNLASGWDIVSIRVQGRSVPPTRKGEFETAEEAEKAAYERGSAFKKENFPER